MSTQNNLVSECNICQSQATYANLPTPQDYEFGIKEDIAYTACERCGVHFLDPLPQPDRIAEYYPKNYSNFEKHQNFFIRTIYNNYYRSEATRMRKLVQHKASLLDVGCGDGGFLSALRQQTNWKLEGLEVNRKAADKTGALGFSVQVSDLETAKLKSEHYDVIRMNHVLEHFLSPEAALNNAVKALRPGGYIIGETPNIDCFDYRLFGKYWGGMHYPRHLFLFTHRAIRALADKLNLEVVHMKNCFRPVGWSGGIQNWLAHRLKVVPRSGGRFPWYPLLLIFFLPINGLQSLFGKTGVVEFCLRKR